MLYKSNSLHAVKSKLSFKKSSTLPGMKYGHTINYVGDCLYCFGGWEGNRCSNSMYILKSTNGIRKKKLSIN